MRGNLRFKAGAWRLQVYLGSDPNGRPRFATRTVKAPNTRAGETVARQALAQLLLEQQAGLHPAVERGTVADLIERWLVTRTPDWSEGSARITRARLAQHVVPTMGRMPADRVRPSDIASLYGNLRRGRLVKSTGDSSPGVRVQLPEGRGGLSPSSVRRVHADLSAVFRQAVKWGEIPVNPCAAVTLPKRETRTARPLPDPARVRAAIADAEPWFATLLTLAVHTGARRGELVALRWADVDDGTVRVWQPKVKAWKAVPLGSRTTEVLREWRQACVRYGLAVGDVSPWVFPARNGHHRRPDAASWAWSRLRKRHGLDGVRLHDLRGAMATALLTSGHDVKTVQRRGGWATPDVMLSHYAQQVSTAERAAAEEMDRWLYG